MTRTVLTTDQAEELEELWTEYGAALQRAMAAIRNEGKDLRLSLEPMNRLEPPSSGSK